MVERDKASELYNNWLVKHLRGAPHRSRSEANGKLKMQDVEAYNAELVDAGFESR